MSHQLRRYERLTRFATRLRADQDRDQYRESRCRWYAPGLSVESVRIDNPIPYEFEIQSPYPFIMLIEAMRRDGETELDTLPRSTETDGRQKLILAPGDCALRGWSTPIDRPILITTAHIDPTSQPIADFLRSRDTPFQPILHFQNTALRDTVAKLRYAAENPEIQTGPYGEHLASVLMLELMQVGRAGPHPVKHSSGGLAPKTTAMLRDFIAANLHEDISLADLAALANLSPFHFTRAFKASVGLTPYQFILKRRIDRAKRQLIETDQSIAEIACECGFAGVTQFGRTFRSFCGQSPREWRRQRV